MARTRCMGAAAFTPTLQQLGVVTHGAQPPADGGLALYNGNLHTLPVGFVSLLRTGLLTLAGKFELARLLATLPKVNAPAVERTDARVVARCAPKPIAARAPSSKCSFA